MEERLYEFLDNLNLIQADLDKESALKLIKNTFSNLDEGEDILTSFIATTPGEDGKKAYSVTSNKRIIISPENDEITTLDIGEIKHIANGTGEEENEIKIDTGEENIIINALDSKGAQNVNDALYSGMGEILPEESITEIFGAVPEEEPVEEKSPISVEELPNSDIEEVETKTQNSLDDELSRKNFDEQSFEPASQKTEKGKNKAIIYIVGALVIIAVGFVGINIINYFVRNITAQNEASNYIDLFNQIDEIYATAVNYNNAGAGKSTPQQWEELDKKARDLETKISDSSSNDLTKNLADSVYYYDEAMITAINHGKNFAASNNAYDKSSLTRNLDQANLNRSAVLGFINANFPDLIGQVKDSEDTALPNYPEAERVEQLIKDAESHPSEGAQNRENSQGS